MMNKKQEHYTHFTLWVIVPIVTLFAFIGFSNSWAVGDFIKIAGAYLATAFVLLLAITVASKSSNPSARPAHWKAFVWPFLFFLFLFDPPFFKYKK